MAASHHHLHRPHATGATGSWQLLPLLAQLLLLAAWSSWPVTVVDAALLMELTPGLYQGHTHMWQLQQRRHLAAFPGPASPPTSTQFDVTGFIQAASLDAACVTAAGTGPDAKAKLAHCGGSITIDGQVIVVPDNLVVILPANALTWQELFDQAPAPYAGKGMTGMALTDSPTPIATYEAHVVGNRVVGAGGDRYIAGMVAIAQQALNSGAGFVNFIDYSSGALYVGGTLGKQEGTKLQINDPSGRFGRVWSADDRFTVDADNPTIIAGTGYPMCVPRVTADPSVAGNQDDDLCPLTNRIQRDVSTTPVPVPSTMLDPSQPGGFGLTTMTVAAGGTVVSNGYIFDANKQAPIEVGDYITFAGLLVNESPTPTATVAGSPTFIAAHSITNNFAAYTKPGANPAYVMIETSLIGTGGLSVLGTGEAAVRTRFEGMTTDPTRKVHIYGIDINPVTGDLMDRDWGYVLPDPGPPNGAVFGRWRIRPPCTGTASTVSDKLCVPPRSGNYMPAPQEVRAVVEGGFTAPISSTSPTAANGIVYGQYHAPIAEFIFPENVPGSPMVPNNFEAIQFLAYGGYASSTGVMAGQLKPWPGPRVPPPAVCRGAATGGPYSVSAGKTVMLVGVTGLAPTAPTQVFWTASVGTFGGTEATTTPTFDAKNLAAGTTVQVTFTVTNVCGPATATTTISVINSTPPTLSLTATSTSVAAGAPITITATSGATGPLIFRFTQSGGLPAALAAGDAQTTAITRNSPAVLTFNAPATATFLTLSVTVQNGNGVVSAPVSLPIPITVNPPVQNIQLTAIEYRTGQQRLSITATLNAPADPAAVLVLKPYMTREGTLYDPFLQGDTFTNAGATFTLTLVGAPPPACNAASATYATPCTLNRAITVVNTNTPGSSAATALTRIRQ